ncbi:MAG TPA: hypothetical protein PK419_05135 [Spirochaetota bacterium]|nr:hypothetical protein [Spirochaetota bacterium]HOH38425.1 hypothetical protein [Spirochaetota bacterium]HPY02815.1 hypothetical protein [Spirochaetota bacterium]HQA52218.1 hypothetical protein [Spirochaetota bacterium]
MSKLSLIIKKLKNPVKEKDSRIILIEKLETLTAYLEKYNIRPWRKVSIIQKSSSQKAITK